MIIGPVIEKLKIKFKGEIKFGKVNIDDNQELAKKFKILSIPNFILLKKENLKSNLLVNNFIN